MTKERRLLLTIVAVIALAVTGLGIAAFFAVKRAATRLTHALQSSGLDNQWGDQWLKSAVANIELHKLRYGKYPRTLQDLRYLGPMDLSLLYNIDYFPNDELTAYYLEVRVGFFGKPHLEYPEEFWMGTGFRKELNPQNNPTLGSPKPNPRLQPTGQGAAGG